MNAVSARGLARSFGDLIAVDGVDLEVEPGRILGIIGPDGAGKTTLLRLLTGVLAADRGAVEVWGHDIRTERDEVRRLIGYMSQAFGLYEDLTVLENIRFFASLRGVRRREGRAREERLLAFTRLAPFTGRLAGALSGGMKQKLGLICTLVHAPRVLFLDEPTNGVDPVSRREFWDIIGELKGEVTVVVATPYMDEAERCDGVVLMAGGRFVAAGSPSQLKASFTIPVWEVEGPRPMEVAEALEAGLPEAEVHLVGDVVRVTGEVSAEGLADALGALAPETSSRKVAPGMEDVFVHHTAEAEAP